MVEYDEDEKNNYQYIVLEVDEAETGVGRDELVQVLWAENVLARRYFYPGCHRMEPYRSERTGAGRALPVTEELAGKLLVLPTGTSVEPGDVSLIGKIIRTAISDGPAIRQHLAVGEVRTGSS